jgi:hypothetical protein
VANLTELLVYVRNVYNTTIEENMLLCKLLEITTTEFDIFNMVDSYFAENSIDWKNVAQ